MGQRAFTWATATLWNTFTVEVDVVAMNTQQKDLDASLERLVQEKVEAELDDLSSEGREPIKGDKTVKEVVAAIMPGVRQGCVLAPSLFNACMDWVLDKVVDQSDCGASVGNTKITDLVFADDAVIFAESLEVLVMALEALHEEAKPLGLEVSWLKTKVQVFGDLLDEAVQSVYACGEDIEIFESFTYLGSAVHNDGGSRQEVLRRIGIAHGVMDSLSGSIWRCRYLCRRTKIRIFKSLVIPVLLYGCETWTLNSNLKRRINAFESQGHVDRLAIVVTSPSLEGEKLLAIPALPSGTGEAMASKVEETIRHWKFEDRVGGLCFDTTASNTGVHANCCTLLEQKLGRPLLNLACRHHVMELILASAFKATFGDATSGPDVQLFKRFQKKWPTLIKANATIINDPRLADHDEWKRTTLEALAKAAATTRDDYKELVELTAKAIKGEVPTTFRKPGAHHYARWMAKAIYTLKMTMFKNEFELTPRELRSLQETSVFIILIYARAWSQYPTTHPEDTKGSASTLPLADPAAGAAPAVGAAPPASDAPYRWHCPRRRRCPLPHGVTHRRRHHQVLRPTDAATTRCCGPPSPPPPGTAAHRRRHRRELSPGTKEPPLGRPKKAVSFLLPRN
ncbi:Retrovirus-related Pol polyprotein from type-1 retrotransposable element R2 [Chionoecetes opilio]|uniref:Retrovirus-related Pol polyprotein from type-1 retrotransposable element R2 n=1 Tax=Chionoecetes opilio TaxID=41210 RepID=A0A8J4XTS7_CHIOP|nr:Retrovirus-related Pol polyprotein from type-1 retrotransposable element R2 [Chionoecetes opilio]